MQARVCTGNTFSLRRQSVSSLFQMRIREGDDGGFMVIVRLLKRRCKILAYMRELVFQE